MTLVLKKLCALAATLLPVALHAAAVTKADNTNALGLATSWVGGTAPGPADVAIWAGAYSADPTTNSLRAVMSGTALSWQGLSVGALSGTALTTNTFYAGTTNISAASQSGTLVTITTKANHGFAPGQAVAIAGITPDGYNGTFTVFGVPSATTFTYSNSPGLAAGTAFGTVESAIYIGGSGSSVANSSLSIGTSGIDLAAATHSAVLIATGLAFPGNQTWNVAAARNLRLGGGGVSAASAKAVASGSDGLIDISGNGVVDANQGGGTGMADAGGFTGFTGKWRVNSGATLRGLRNGATAWGSNPDANSITLNGGTLAVGGISGAVGNWTWTNAITLAAGTTSYIDEHNVAGSARYLKLNGPISGSGNLVLRDTGPAGTFTDPNVGYILTGANTLSGTLTIGGPVENGVTGRPTYVRVGGIGGSSTGTGIGGDGTLGTATIINNGLLTFALNTAITINTVSGTGSLRVGYTAAAGSELQNVTLTGANTYTGNTTINMGTLTLAPGASIPNTANIFLTPPTSASLVTVYLDASQAGGLTLNSGQRLVGGPNNVGGNNTAIVIGNVTAGSGNAIVPGGTNAVNTFVISGDLTLTGGTTLVYDLNSPFSSDLLTVNNLNVSGLTSFAITPPAGGLAAGDYTLITASGTLGGSAANFTHDLSSAGRGQTFSIIYSGNSVVLHVVGSPAALVWKGDNTANVWNTWSGGSGATNWVNAGVPDAFFTSDAVTFDDTGFNTPVIKLTGGLQPSSTTVSAAQNYTFAGSGKLTGSGSLTNAGSGTLSILTSNDFTGKILLSGGTLMITNSSALGNNPPAFVADQFTFDGGTLRVTNSLNLGNTNRGITVGALGGVMDVPASVTVTLSNSLAGTGPFIKTNAGALNLNGLGGGYSGYLTVAGGSAKLGAAYGAGGSGFFGGKIAVQSGSFDINGMTDYANGGQTNERTWLVANGSSLVLGGGPASSSSALIDSTGTNGFGVYLGKIQYDATGDPGMATVAAFWKQNGQSISALNQVDVGDSLNATIELDFTGGMSRPDLLEGKQTTIEKIGAGTMRISCANSFPGLRITDGQVIVNHPQALGVQHTWTNFLNDVNLVTVNGGTLNLNGFSNQIGGLAGLGGVVLNNGTTPSVFNVGIDDTNTVNSEYAGVIQDGAGGISLVKRGPGRLTLSGANTFVGGTTVSNGTLVVNGSLAGAVAVEAGAKVGGNGTIGGVLTVGPGGVVAPGDGIATLTLSKSPVLDGVVRMEVDRNNGVSLADQLVVTGNPIAYGGTLVIINTGAPLRPGDTFRLFTAGGYSGGFTLVSQTPGQVITWNTANLTVDGTISVATAPGAPLSAFTSGGTNLNISWPSEALGAQLLAQTNAPGQGLSTNWFPWPGSTNFNTLSLPIDPANGSVFLQLVYPPQ